MNNFSLIIKEEARSEISDAYFWYEEKQNNLGERFLNKLDDCFITIKNNPKICAKKHKNMRQAIIDVFPFIVIYEIEKTDIVVYAVFNTHRNPEKWKKRV
ncbi:MAG: type II toxin-antitoxin system RelE/ParE family toxin [Bacteroidales bacterium]|nr:type II toxin-antitoxin system RelE/ParE family toxin [Bacteroidales bacterium]